MAFSLQLSLRLSPRHRQLVRNKMEELRKASPTPNKVTEAEAIRIIIEQSAQIKESIHGQ